MDSSAVKEMDVLRREIEKLPQSSMKLRLLDLWTHVEEEVRTLESKLNEKAIEIEHARELLQQETQISDEVRSAACIVLGEWAVHGDSSGVPGILDIVNELVKEIEETRDTCRRFALDYYDAKEELEHLKRTLTS